MAAPSGPAGLWRATFTLLAGAVTLFIYSPSRVTVVCAKQPGDDELAF